MKICGAAYAAPRLDYCLEELILGTCMKMWPIAELMIAMDPGAGIISRIADCFWISVKKLSGTTQIRRLFLCLIGRNAKKREKLKKYIDQTGKIRYNILCTAYQRPRAPILTRCGRSGC